MPDYLKGFSALGYFPVTADTSSAYAVGATRTLIPSAVSCSKTDNRNTLAIAADDNPEWDYENELASVDLSITVREMSLADLRFLAGAEIGEDGTTEEGSFDDAPIVALNFRGLKKGNGYRGFRYYAAKLTSYENTLSTKGESNSAPTVVLHFHCMPRNADGKIRGKNDFSTGAACDTWLAAIPSVGEQSDNPPVKYFTEIVQVSALPAEPSLTALYVLTASAKVGDATYAAGDTLYYDGTAWKPYVAA